MLLTCSKCISDIPFAHRQPKHEGHCALIHGHNWSFTFTFQAAALDECGFVVDFGKLKWLRKFLEDTFDHALVLSRTDPQLGALAFLDTQKIARIVLVDDGSCEGLLTEFYPLLNAVVQKQTEGRVWISELTLHEDAKNFATIRP
tara:strand:- start:3414 stop:3848 length:435 start_codon:yes stop_codon:yes gene_type:complete